MPAGFKNSRKLWTNGQDPNIPVRLLNLENNEYKVTYYEIISGASGSLTLPTGATINAGEFGLSGNCILSKIDGSNKPTFESPKTSGGTIVTASLNVSTGAWVASGTYTDSDVALIYSIKIKAVNYSNLDYDFIIETVDSEVVRETSTQTLTNKTFDSPTITVGGITVSSTELSYLDSATSNIQTQLNSKTKIVGFDTADALTPANTSNNVIKSITIPANTYTDGNVLRLFGGGDKTGTAGTITVRIYANTVNNLTGTPILMAQSVFTNTNLTFQIDRNLFVRSTTTWGYASNVNNSMGHLASSTINSNDLAIDWTVTQYIIIAIQLANGADQVNVKVFAVVNF